MNTKQEQQQENVPANENTAANIGSKHGQPGQEHIDTNLENVANENGDPSQTQTIPSDADTEEALKHDNLHDDSSLEPDTPGQTNQYSQDHSQDEAVPS